MIQIGKSAGKLLESRRTLRDYHRATRTVEGIVQPTKLMLFRRLNVGCSYSYLTYITAYLRTHYKEHYMAALLNASKNDRSKFLNGLKSCKSLGIEIRPPQVSKLEEDCIVEGTNIIRLGTSICKNLKKSGSYAVQAAKEMPKNLFEFVGLLNRSKLNVRAAKAMVSAGSLDEYTYFDSFKLNRTALRVLVEQYYEWYRLNEAKKEAWDRWLQRKTYREEQELLKQQGLDYGKRLVGVGKEPELPPVPDPKNLLEIPDQPFENALAEYEILSCTMGPMPTEYFYREPNVVSIKQLKDELWDNFDDVNTVSRKAKIICIIAESDERRTAAGKSMASLLVEDDTDATVITIFSQAYEKIKATIGKFEDLSCFVFDVTARLGYARNSEEPELTINLNSYSEPILDKKKLRLIQSEISAKTNFDSLDDLVRFLEAENSYVGEITYKRLKGYKEYVRKDSSHQ